MPIIGAVMVPHPPIILPEIGRGEEKKIHATSDAYEKAMQFVASLQPETVVIAPGDGVATNVNAPETVCSRQP